MGSNLKKEKVISGAPPTLLVNRLKNKRLPESNKSEAIFFNMKHFPTKEKDETFSKTVLVFDEFEKTFCDLGYYDFEKREWVILGDMSMNLICWCYLPNPTEFLNTKRFSSVKHRGYR